ncbi:hypothetical protein Aph01nite_28910 [Acrocarpospora phusangensis]|uniref:HAD family phosphatase n=1 Tax=Acrocarpospora phusangensis TaxID=1070424 RepID=A0A919Q9A9_9ACTN|nr:HAD family hydrolase [Acrocarpospora phusangensis]GIH24581.1 hypothetical protein Aph01nite_28910 [Acrocarpospora phusangensis]
MSRAAAAIVGRRVWLCDLDGTLVDSSPVHEAAFRAAITEIAPGLLGSFTYDGNAGASTRQVVAGLGADPAVMDRLVWRKQRLYREYVDAGRVRLFPGARRLLECLTDRGRTAYLVSSGSRGSVERVLAACGLAGWFRAALTADDAPSAKPDPGFYLRACQDWAVDPADAVAVEDSTHGVASAVGAGLLTLQVHTDEPALGAVPVRDLDEIVSLLGTEAKING